MSGAKRLRVAFMGSPDFAVPTLAALLEAGHQVVAVYAQPPRPSGRGHHLNPTPVHAYAQSQGLDVRTPLSLKGVEEQQAFRALDLDVAVVVAYGLLLPQAVIDAPRLGTLNAHGSLLPRWRGAAPMQRAILAGDTETGITIMRVELKLDAGPMLLKHAVPLDEQTTIANLHDQLAALSATLMVQALEQLAGGTVQETIQPEDGVTYAHKLEKEEGVIQWHEDSQQLHRKIRALNPWPGVWCQFNGERIKILEANLHPGTGNTGHEPGQVIAEPLVVACGSGALALTKLQRAAKAPLTAEELLRGFSIPVGSYFN